MSDHYHPTWHGPIEGYAVNQATRNAWRFTRTHDRADLVQEAAVVFMRCSEAYPTLREARHFMALFKTALERRFNDLARQERRRKSEVPLRPLSDDDEVYEVAEAVGDTENAGFVRVMLQQAPREVASVLALFLNAPAELLELAEDAWRQQNGGPRRGDANAMVRRMLGESVGSRPVDACRAYFFDTTV